MPEQLYTISSLGDSALLIDFGNHIDEEINKFVIHLFHRIISLQHPALLDVVPAYSSLAVHYDVLSLHEAGRSAYNKVVELVEPIIHSTTEEKEVENNHIEIPVCYSDGYGPDIEEILNTKQITKEQLIQLHTGKTYRVYMLGFLPGFPYMGEVDDRIAIERKSTPRQSIPAGSVGIAGKQTGIYPLESPGGWQIIGRTPLKIFNKDNDQPVLFQPGDSVRFYSITEDEYKDHESRSA
jgi:inhibitor of KinA